ncbi:hypothetical protein D6D19_00169 [Aureobasidium pullulans]|uniref:Uncharacterized protein n=1 Tax=Aureobasidium pullulans TaxID=5580 RepID=A0A4S9CL51_AURPU|nr:hypothetical protein D6D26_05162 [Aureobasidium pullulans]THW21042.1 hypothetical protein D6D24_01951 [Aureobasidium pullulans]THW80758.1 hypothetical protein D6D19_00169 [Aureobasidium pullulans]THX07976.1 hypothetical protein D6D18_02033 [Aureobasidium pullulans]THY04480.1 hypothetical protein D6D03_03621 [Aureobasidium pullulans]
MSENSSQGLDHPCPSTISTPYLLPQGLVAPSQAEAKIAALSVEQQHETAKQQRLQQRQEYQIQYYRKLPARRWEETRAAAESYERKNIVTQQPRLPVMKQTVRTKKYELAENSTMMQNPMQEAMQEQRKVTTQAQRLANMRRTREAKKLQQREAAKQQMNEDANHNRQQLVCPPISWEQFYGQKFKMHIKDCQSGHSNETRTKLLQRIDNEYAEYHQQFYKQQRDDQKKCDEEEGNDISELTQGMKNMSIAQAAEEKITEVKQDIVEVQAPVQDVGDHDGYMDLGEQGTEDGEDWVVVN